MRLDRLRQFALRLPHTTVVKQWGETLVFKVAGKMFLIISLDGDIVESLSFKCAAEEFRELTDVDGIVPAPYLARASWVCLEDPAALPFDEVTRWIQNSYSLVAAKLSKRVRTELGLEAPRERG